MNINTEHLPWYPEGDLRLKNKRSLMRMPSLWVCPECGTVNAWNWEDAERASKRLGVKVEVCSGSCFDNICGHCGADIVNQDSPILAPCYTHSED